MIGQENMIAHAKRNTNGPCDEHHLEDHLKCVAQKAADFASHFASEGWAELAAYWHDLGKFHPDWQAYLRRETGCDEDAHIENKQGRPNHSTVGAVLAMQRIKPVQCARILAYLIAGHHAGLPDWYPDDAGGDLQNRLFTEPIGQILDTTDLDVILNHSKAEQFIEKALPRSAPLGITNSNDLEMRKEHLHLWMRMLFSCLVDADFLDTEAFMNYKQGEQRGDYHSMSDLKSRFDVFMNLKQNSSPNSPINQKRKEILQACRDKAKLKSGFFSLNVPTGGGKTLSSMAFALEHAIMHDKRRIIFAIPYTSIIEQTAKVFKYGSDIEDEIKERSQRGEFLFGEDQVVEHHSNVDPESEDSRNRLACENWDAPIIVTTNVQLFESLCASRTSSCRKLHNIVNSVIILDEVQMLPPEFLKPILSVLRGLVEHFGVTVVLMTATQPTFEGIIGQPPNQCLGIQDITHIIDNPITLAAEFRRVDVSIPTDLNFGYQWPEIRDKLLEHQQVLCIVNSRKDCRDLHALMPEDTIHLSALMCGEERSEIISGIKGKLNAGKSIRVISTQLVEAGVDIDFPVVFRALAGMDSIAQAAGRCNREMKLAELGKVVVFNSPRPAPTGLLRKGEDACKILLRRQGVDDLSPDIFREYFTHYYSSVNDFDKPKFNTRLVRDASDFIFQFRTFAQDFKLIDDSWQRSVIVWYQNTRTGNNSYHLLDLLRRIGPDRWLLRKLQRFTVNISQYNFDQIRELGLIEQLHGYWVQCDSSLYKPSLGLICDDTRNPNDFIV